MRPKFAQIGRAHGLLKTHKKFEVLPPFRPIVDTTNTPYYGIVKFLANLLNPLTLNDFTVKDSFDAANKIQQIPKELFDSGYKFMSFDVISLFTNVPLAKTIDIILKRVYSEKLVTTNLTKRTMKKLLKDACAKIAFIFNDKIYKQIDCVSMESPLGPLLANVFMTELEKDIIQKLIDKNFIKFYIWYVDDTLLLVKDEDINPILKELNSYNKNIKFTVDRFINEDVHFLDIKIHQNNTDIYYKDTHTDQYINYRSQTPWKLKTSWIKALYHRANKQALDKQISHIKTFTSWNGYPKRVRNSVIKRLDTNKSHSRSADDDDDRKKIWLDLPYNGKLGEKLVTSLIKKLKRYFKENVKACIRYFYQIFIFSRNDSPSNTMKNAFYFIKTALFFLKMFKFLYFCPPLFFSQSAVALEDDSR